MKDWGLRGLCFLQHFNTWLAQMLSSVQFSRSQWNELLICKCGRTVCVFVHIFPQSPEGAHSVHLWEWACWGKTLSMLHTKPSPSPSLSIFPSLPSSLPAAVFLSELESGAKLFFPPSSRHKQELTDLLTSTNTHSFFFCLCPVPHSFGCWLCTDLILDYRLRGKYSHSFTWLLWLRVHIAVWEPPDYSEKCFHGKMSHRPLLFLDLLLSFFQSLTFSLASRLSIGKTVVELIPCWQSPKVFFSPFLTVLQHSQDVCMCQKNLEIK